MNKKKKTGKTKETLENSYLFDNNRDDTNILKHILFYFLQKHMKNLGKWLLLVTAVVAGIAIWGGVFAQFGADVGGVGQIGVAGTQNAAGTGTNLLDIIKSFINWILGLLSLIALGMALYGGFQMVTAAGDDGKYKEGFKVLKQAAIGLIIVGFSWIIVSSIFWLIGGFSSGGTPTSGQ